MSAIKSIVVLHYELILCLGLNNSPLHPCRFLLCPKGKSVLLGQECNKVGFPLSGILCLSHCVEIDAESSSEQNTVFSLYTSQQLTNPRGILCVEHFKGIGWECLNC